jgi:hypothetical protein
MSGKRKQPTKAAAGTRGASPIPEAPSSTLAALDISKRLLDSIRLGPHFTEREMVNHPTHYGGDTTYEVVKVLEAWGLESDALLWNAVKYISRAGKKSINPLPDLLKAQWYLNRRIANIQRIRVPGGCETKDA